MGRNGPLVQMDDILRRLYVLIVALTREGKELRKI